MSHQVHKQLKAVQIRCEAIVVTAYEDNVLVRSIWFRIEAQ
jgi:hypothetical protein